MVRRFRGKPVEVEAIEWTGQNLVEIQFFSNGLAHMKARKLLIETTEGTSHAQIGDFIVKGTEGEIYPVKPRVMAKKYDEVS